MLCQGRAGAALTWWCCLLLLLLLLLLHLLRPPMKRRLLHLHLHLQLCRQWPLCSCYQLLSALLLQRLVDWRSCCHCQHHCHQRPCLPQPWWRSSPACCHCQLLLLKHRRMLHCCQLSVAPHLLPLAHCPAVGRPVPVPVLALAAPECQAVPQGMCACY